MRLVVAVALLATTLALGCGSSDQGSETSSEAPATETAPPVRDGYGGSREAPPVGSSEAPAGAAVRSCETQAVDAERLRATAVSCGEARRVMFAWQRAEGCGLIGDASRGSCVVRSYRCLSVRTERGVSVSCARPGRSIAFLAQRG